MKNEELAKYLRRFSGEPVDWEICPQCGEPIDPEGPRHMQAYEGARFCLYDFSPPKKFLISLHTEQFL